MNYKFHIRNISVLKDFPFPNIFFTFRYLSTTKNLKVTNECKRRPILWNLNYVSTPTLHLIPFRCLASNRLRKKNHFPNLKNPVQTKDQVKKQSGPPCLLEGYRIFFSALKLQWSITFTLLADMSVCLVNLNRYQHSIWVLMWSTSVQLVGCWLIN